MALASHGTANEGWFDGPALMQAFRRKARELGVQYIADEVVGLAPNAVTLRSGGRLEARTIVLAAGPWSGEVAATAGIALPVEPRRRSVFVFDVREPPGPTPLVIDPVGHLVPARRPLLCRRHDTGRGQRPAGRAARSPAPGMGRHGVAGAWPTACRLSRRPRW